MPFTAHLRWHICHVNPTGRANSTSFLQQPKPVERHGDAIITLAPARVIVSAGRRRAFAPVINRAPELPVIFFCSSCLSAPCIVLAGLCRSPHKRRRCLCHLRHQSCTNQQSSFEPADRIRARPASLQARHRQRVFIQIWSDRVHAVFTSALRSAMFFSNDSILAHLFH